MEVVLILIYGQIIFFEEAMKVSLGTPNQVRSSGNILDDSPKKFPRFGLIHGMCIPDKDLTITFKLTVMMS